MPLGEHAGDGVAEEQPADHFPGPGDDRHRQVAAHAGVRGAQLDQLAVADMPTSLAFRAGPTEIKPRSERHRETFEAGLKIGKGAR